MVAGPRPPAEGEAGPGPGLGADAAEAVTRGHAAARPRPVALRHLDTSVGRRGLEVRVNLTMKWK